MNHLSNIKVELRSRTENLNRKVEVGEAVTSEESIFCRVTVPSMTEVYKQTKGGVVKPRPSGTKGTGITYDGRVLLVKMGDDVLEVRASTPNGIANLSREELDLEDFEERLRNLIRPSTPIASVAFDDGQTDYVDKARSDVDRFGSTNRPLSGHEYRSRVARHIRLQS